MSDPASPSGGHSPFLEIPRAEWAELAPHTTLGLTEDDLTRVRGVGDTTDLAEAREVFLQLSRLIKLYIAAARELGSSTNAFLRHADEPTPFVIGVAGSVAVGKSTTARLLAELLAQGDETPHVQLVTTDGFLYPNAELERRGLMHRKGFPESYDRRALLGFVSRVKSGEREVSAPVYSHLVYDIVPGERVVVNRPDVLIVEGLNVLRPSSDGRLAVSDLFDFTIYVDARSADIEEWYVQRFLRLQRGAFADPQSYFHRFAHLGESEAVAWARAVWDEINGPNLEQNILPTRARASLVLRKASDHTVATVLLRRV